MEQQANRKKEWLLFQITSRSALWLLLLQYGGNSIFTSVIVHVSCFSSRINLITTCYILAEKESQLLYKESGFAEERDEGSWTQWLLDQIVVQSL